MVATMTSIGQDAEALLLCNNWTVIWLYYVAIKYLIQNDAVRGKLKSENSLPFNHIQMFGHQKKLF